MITGIGVVSGLGADSKSFLAGLRESRCGISRLPASDAESYASAWAGRVPGDPLLVRGEFPPRWGSLSAAGGPDRCTRTELLCLTAATEALDDDASAPRARNTI